MESNQRIKVLVATGLYPPEIGGPATFVKMLEENLDSSQFELTVVPFTQVRKYPKIFRHIIFFFKLLSQARAQDIILALDGVSVGLPAALVAKIKHLPFIVRLGGDYAWEQGRLRFNVTESLDDFYAAKSLPFFVKFLTKVQAWVVSTAVKVIAPSEYLKSIVSKWENNQEKIKVIYSVPSLPLSVEKQVSSSDSQIIWSIARLVPWKGFETLIKVVGELQSEYPNLLLKIIGDGPEEQKLTKLIQELGLEKQVVLTGRLSHSELIKQINEVNMFVLNTEYEGFSHLVLEMMRLKVPVVTTNVGGNPELVSNNETGLLVEYNNELEIKNAIISLLEDTVKAAQLSENAYQKSLQYTKENSVKEIAATIMQVLNKNI